MKLAGGILGLALAMVAAPAQAELARDMDLGRWGIELNVRQPLDSVLVQNTGFELGIQLDLRVGVRL